MVTNLLLFYGFFLITCGIAAFTFIGIKAKTALISGSLTGSMALVISYYSKMNFTMAKCAAIVLTAMLFCVFAWRATITFLKLLDLVSEKSEERKSKAIAFLIISLMAIISMLFFALLVTL
jgi:uncharacterized membrane protein (UPF0136 family)